ncbi:MAG: 50S ribosomal protein L11 methyltransferase [Bacteroidetes bacterium]|nr:50S ribosomal protein L11 methyltransferase [Bacteroidota bacterium]
MIRIKYRSVCWIVPTWHQSPDPQAIDLILDLPFCFWHRQYPTTQLCLGWLDQNLQRGNRVIDYGAFPGILAIAKP